MAGRSTSTVTAPNNADILTQLSRILADQAAVHELLTLPKTRMPREEKRRLAELDAHFNASRKRRRSDDFKDDDCTDTEDEGPMDKKPKWTPWKDVMKLDSVELPHAIWRHIAAHNSDATAFMKSSFGAGIAKILEGALTDRNKAVAACYGYTKKVMCEIDRNVFRRLFMMLGWYDYATKVIRPGSSGRWSDKMQKEVLRENIEPAMGEMPEKSQSAVTGEILAWSAKGKKLAFLCETFGNGCLFFLADLLTDRFLERHCSTRGAPFEEAERHLRELGLPLKAVSSGANELATNIRAIFLRQLQMPTVLPAAPPVAGV